MMIIQWLCQAMQTVREWASPVGYEFAPAFQRRRDVRRRSVSVLLLLAGIGWCSAPLTAWSGEVSSFEPVKPRTVVSAGVGYESAETSTITVKTYDAETGAILSHETYELDVREDVVPEGGKPRERIFAGGVSPGADGLSAFTLRVYDAVTGAFLWEGLLNLSGGNQESDLSHQVVAHLEPKQASVSRVHSRNMVEGQPQFSLRALDPATGKPVWSDHFSASAGRLAQVERIGRAVVSQTEAEAASARQIEFRIRMVNDRDRQLLWEDLIAPAVDETVAHNESAQNLPVWRGTGADETRNDAI